MMPMSQMLMSQPHIRCAYSRLVKLNRQLYKFVKKFPSFLFFKFRNFFDRSPTWKYSIGEVRTEFKKVLQLPTFLSSFLPTFLSYIP